MIIDDKNWEVVKLITLVPPPVLDSKMYKKSLFSLFDLTFKLYL